MHTTFVAFSCSSNSRAWSKCLSVIQLFSKLPFLGSAKSSLPLFSLVSVTLLCEKSLCLFGWTYMMSFLATIMLQKGDCKDCLSSCLSQGVFSQLSYLGGGCSRGSFHQNYQPSLWKRMCSSHIKEGISDNCTTCC